MFDLGAHGQSTVQVFSSSHQIAALDFDLACNVEGLEVKDFIAAVHSQTHSFADVVYRGTLVADAQFGKGQAGQRFGLIVRTVGTLGKLIAVW